MPETEPAEPAEATGPAEATEPAEPAEVAAPPVPDDVLLASVGLARAALLEITPASTVGAPIGHFVEGEHVLSLLFECTMPGYPGWNWTVTVSRIDDDSEPSVLEAELMPGDRALLAPDWVPWSERLADYQASQEALHAAEAGALDDDDDDEPDDGDESDDDESFDDESDDDDEDEDDDDDDDDAPVHRLHSGDIDGIDIESADASYDDESDDEGPDDEESDDDSAPLDGEVDESDDAEHETDDDSPQPPAVTGGDEAGAEDEHGDEGDQPQA